MITVLGASGFIGSHLVERLGESGIDYYAPGREEKLSKKNLGVLIYCIGLTADFRVRPLDTVAAHVCKFLEIFRQCEFESLIYLSSTRLYGLSSTRASEEDLIKVDPLDPSALYNISKVMGESLAITAREKATVVRLSNVYGADRDSHNFLSEILRGALHDKKISLNTSLDSEKDYVGVTAVVDLLIEMAKGCSRQIYNVASGRNYSNSEIAERIRELTGCKIEVAPNAQTTRYPQIDISRIKQEFAFTSSSLLDDMDTLVNFYRRDDKEPNDFN